jgi:hypothetical protein
MEKEMKTALFIIQLIPAIIEIIKKIEETFPQPKIGSEKLQLLREILEATYSGISSIWPTIALIVEKIVAFANAKGAFVKSSE